MRIAYLDCFAGISGDMFLGALIDAGLDPAILHETVAALDLNATLKIEKVDRSGISATKVLVYEGAKLAEHTHPASPADDSSHHQQIHPHQHLPKIQHHHKAGHAHDHPHGDLHPHDHPHGRSLSVIRNLINAAPLAPAVKQIAIHAFELLGASEATIHNLPCASSTSATEPALATPKTSPTSSASASATPTNPQLYPIPPRSSFSKPQSMISLPRSSPSSPNALSPSALSTSCPPPFK